MTAVLVALLLAQVLPPPPCALAQFMAAVLATQHKEHIVATSKTVDRRTVELWSAKGWATWTLTVTEPGGMMCILSAGKGRPGRVGAAA